MQNSSHSQFDAPEFSSPDRSKNRRSVGDYVDDLSEMTVKVTMQSTSSLMNVLVTVSRIGAQIDFVSAKNSMAILTVSARPQVARRVPSLLRELVEVIDVSGLK